MKKESKGKRERGKMWEERKKRRKERRNKTTWNKYDVVFRFQNSIVDNQELILLSYIIITKVVLL